MVKESLLRKQVHGVLVMALQDIFGGDNSLWFHTDHRQNNILELGERAAGYINESVGIGKKKFSINFTIPSEKHSLSFYYDCG